MPRGRAPRVVGVVVGVDVDLILVVDLVVDRDGDVNVPALRCSRVDDVVAVAVKDQVHDNDNVYVAFTYVGEGARSSSYPSSSSYSD